MWHVVQCRFYGDFRHTIWWDSVVRLSFIGEYFFPLTSFRPKKIPFCLKNSFSTNLEINVLRAHCFHSRVQRPAFLFSPPPYIYSLAGCSIAAVFISHFYSKSEAGESRSGGDLPSFLLPAATFVSRPQNFPLACKLKETPCVLMLRHAGYFSSKLNPSNIHLWGTRWIFCATHIFLVKWRKAEIRRRSKKPILIAQEFF